MKHCFTFIVYNDVHSVTLLLLSSSKTENEQTNRDGQCARANADLGKGIYNQREKEEEDQGEITSYIIYLYICISAGKYCWNKDYRTIISSSKGRYEWIVVLVAARTGLFVVYGWCVVDKAHLVGNARL